MDDEIMLDNFKEKTQIMKVRNLKWEKMRHFDKPVIRIRPCERNGKRFLYVAVDGK